MASTVHANESTLPEAPIFIDGKPFKTQYIMRDGHLLVPAIFLKNTGVLVDWNEQYKSVVFQTGEIKFALPVGKKFSDDYVKETDTWKRSLLTTKTVMYAGQPFVPLLNVAEKLAMNVKYDPQLRRTFITSNIFVTPNTIKSATTKEKFIALTFDDGPENYYTPQILNILKEKRVPATFFVMGKQVKAYPEEMKRIVAEGHGIANHTYLHPDLRKKWSHKVKEEIQLTQQELQRVVGRTPDLFRPPYGAITKADITILNQLGMRNIMWNLDTLDWSGVSAEEILEIVHRDISPGAIILLHNFQDGRLLDGAVEALPKIIDELHAKGYKFVTLQTMLEKQ